MLGALPPAGDSIVFGHDAETVSSAPWTAAGQRACYYASGTQALGAAIAAALVNAQGRTEIILPAYGCPALVTATLWAGGTPVLVDLEPESARMDLAAVEECLDTGAVAALVAVHFLGLSERVATLAALCRRHDVSLIEDSAQAVPVTEDSSAGDITIYSFGRGKPVSVMGGGVAVVHRGELLDRLPRPDPGPPLSARRWRRRLDVVTYNVAIQPLPFRLLSSVPGSRIGETRYKSLAGLWPADPRRLAWLPANFARYARRHEWVPQQFSEAISTLTDMSVVELSRRMEKAGDARLLRYPVLLPDRETRDQALARLRRAGLGASSMYGAILPDIAGMPAPVCNAEGFVHADNLADRLLTLPTHERVGNRHVAAVARILQNI